MLPACLTVFPSASTTCPAQRWEYGEVGATRRRLGVASGAKRLGIAVIDIDPGKRSTPPHSHADEDEAFLVLAGSGLSYQTSGSEDVRTYPIVVDDLLWHPAGDAHTLIPGDPRPRRAAPGRARRALSGL